MNVAVALPRIKETYSYEEYREMVLTYAVKSMTSGDEQLPKHIEATKLNAQRMKRLDKQLVLHAGISESLKQLKEQWIWLLLAETWCGDGAQCIPIIAKIAANAPSIELKIILRDQNPEIMNAYLTNQSRSIPKLICLSADTMEEVGTWGPRPAIIQQMVLEFKKQNPGVSHEEFVKNLHLWYARDKGDSLQKEFEQLIPTWIAGTPKD